ncbi:MAG: hypothetical protein KOO66_09610 [Bacteroidales bacterium]|nr:hypothetical protein [Bacteroidales bacterium]
MEKYTYKCVPVPSIVEMGKNKHLEAIQKYEDKINKMALEGWELALIDSLTTKYNPGCLAGILGGKGETITHKFLVFKMKLKKIE